MQVKAYKTRKVIPPKDDLWEILSTIPPLRENTVVAIASKIISIGQGRCTLIKNLKEKDELVKKEAQKYLPRDLVPNRWVMHTITSNILMPSAGIDESNGAGYFILWPKNPAKTAKKIWKFFRERDRIKNLGVVITDSHSIPLRRGLIGISLAHFGFEPLRDYREKKDLFGRKLHFSMTNLADSLAASAVMVMGEGDEQTPIVMIDGILDIQFVSRKIVSKKPDSTFVISEENDLYRPFLKAVPWKKGSRVKT